MKKSVLVTGSNGGIGTAICKIFTEQGWNVIGVDLADKPVHIHTGSYYSIDLKLFVNKEDYRSKIVDILKGISIDVLINNAAAQVLGKFTHFSFEKWNNTLDVNLSAAFLMIKSTYDSLIKNQGQIINIASIHADQTKPNFFAYATSKAALIGLTKSLAVEFKGEITVNAISPAAVETQMLREGFNNNQDKINQLANLHPSQVIGSTEGIAKFILNLVTENNRFVNGANFKIDGGISSALLDLEI